MKDFNLKNFKLLKVINKSEVNKSIYLTGYFDDKNKIALLLLYKISFIEKFINEFIIESNIEKVILENDIYYKYFSSNQLNEKFELTVIYPASQEQINKYKKNESKIIIDTYQNYYYKILPYIEKISYQNTKWMLNILNGIDEVDKVIYNDNDFILLPDFKWNGLDLDNMYYLGILKNKNNNFIRTIRDLTDSNLLSLKKMLHIGKKTISTKHNIKEDKIIAYVHYYPSYFIFHVHYTFIENEITKSGFLRNILLSEIIQYLEIDSLYYKKINMEIKIDGNNFIYDLINDTNIQVKGEHLV